MRKTPLFVTCGAVLMLGVTGCNREAAVDTDVATTPPASTAPVEPAPAPAPTPATPAPAGTLTLATGAPGSYVADNTGRAVYVLVGDENGFALWRQFLRKPLHVTLERDSITRIGFVDIYLGKFLKIRQADRRGRRN